MNLRCLWLLVLLGMAASLSGVELERGVTVWYFPGWLRSSTDHSEHIRQFQRIFPDSQVRIHRWDSDRINFFRSRDSADIEGRMMGQYFAALPPEELQRTVLVGHSLGARVVVGILQELQLRGLKVSRAIIMAAAINQTDMGDNTAAASINPVLSLNNPRDVTLKYFYGLCGDGGVASVGINGWDYHGKGRVINIFLDEQVPQRIVPPQKIMSLQWMRQLCLHLADFYIIYLAETPQLHPPTPEIQVPQGRVNMALRVMDLEIMWRVLQECQGWKLEENILTRHCRILDDSSTRRAWGNRQEMEESFAAVRKQLQEQ